ncbi:ABA4-like family protein [Bacillus paramycoides]|uniref:ABA4-like family protein n=1 Tax=Bacillus paramycoides TaxID=2026194 RepID=UPI002243590A|nr:ABA4-like family protein [Bacillus paramycoides]MCW9134114.1 ABA4-like family protein [Bacillus paramycoides]
MYEKLFSLAGIAILLWLLLILLPTWRVTRFLADIAIFPVYLAALYAIGIIMAIVDSGFGFVQYFGSAEGVIRLLSKPDFALLVWLHLLCFDQAIGHYVYRDNMEHRYVSIPMQSIFLFLILMFGPLGLLCYLVLRQVRKRNKITL